MDNIEENERRRLGLELHEAEQRIHIGRQAIAEAQANEPVDTVVIETHKAGIHDARLARNGLRRQLQAAKMASNCLPRFDW